MNQAAHAPEQPAKLLAHPDMSLLSGLQLIEAIANGSVPPPPMAQTIPIELQEWSAGKMLITAMPQAQFHNTYAIMHGGWTMTLLDTAMALAASTLLAPGQSCPSTETAVKFVRPIRLSVKQVKVTGQVIHQGNNLITLEGRVFDENGKLYAHGTSTCMVISN